MTDTAQRPDLPGETGLPGSLLRDRALLATTMSVSITDPHQPDSPLVWVNPAFCAMTGYGFDEAVGRNCRFLQGPGSERHVVADIRRGLDAGRPVTATLLNYRKDGTPFWNELSISPIVDETGTLSHFVGVQSDVTTRVHAQQARDAALVRAEVSAGRLALLGDFATKLAASLENADIVALLAEVLVPRLGTWCALHLTEDSDAGTRSIVRHARAEDPAVSDLVRQIDTDLASGLPPNSPTARVLLGELPYVFVPDVAARPDAAGRRTDERSTIAAQLGVASLIVVPLRSRSRILGCAAIMADADRRPYDTADLALAQELATRAALMLENSMLYTRERTAAVTLQRSMMPVVPQLPGLTMAARYLTAADEAAVGGDWYDVFALRDGGVGLAVGDAMGHDVESAAAMGKLSIMLRSYAWPGEAPSHVLDAVDSLLAATNLDYLATCCYGRLRLTEAGARFDYANAGHPYPILRLPDGTAQPLRGAHGPMLGIRPLMGSSEPRVDDTADLPRGSTLVFHTDGLTDSLGDELEPAEALDRLSAIVAAQRVAASPRQLVAALAGFARAGRSDDVVILAVRVD